MQNETKEKSWKRLQILFSNMAKADAWFTGIPVKNYLKQNFFLKNKIDSNKIIQAGRWSGYAHFSALSAFKNILDKHQIESHKTILTHPFLPKEFVDELIERRCKIISFDIEKDTLCWDTKKFKSFLALHSSTTNIDLVCGVSLNGLGKEISEQIFHTESLTIPTFLYLQSPNFSTEISELLSKQSLGSVLWQSNIAFIHNHANLYLQKNQLLPQKIYFSWYFENRMQALLEYHLQQSQATVQQFLSAYYFLVNNYYSKFDFSSKLYSFASKFIVQKSSYSSTQKAEEDIKDAYYRMFETALPDIFFQLEQTFTTIENDKNLDQYFSQTLKKFHQFMVQQINQQSEGSLEIPAIDFTRSYTGFHIFSNIDEYESLLQNQNYQTTAFPSLHKKFTNLENFPNAILCCQYGIFISNFD